jgi:hypothetical protein
MKLKVKKRWFSKKYNIKVKFSCGIKKTYKTQLEKGWELNSLIACLKHKDSIDPNLWDNPQEDYMI